MTATHELRSTIIGALRRYVSLLILGGVLCAVYGPSLTGEFLNYDDPWLVRDNPFLRNATPTHLRDIWTNFSPTVRYQLGAEYLPIRDTSHWLESVLWGINPLKLRIANLAVYFLALLALRGALRAGLPAVAAEAATWLFALHPVHVESVAWISGRKDVLALAFACTALFIYARRPRGTIWLLPLLTALACLSKGVAVVLPALLLAQDILQRRNPETRLMAPVALLCLVAAILHSHVGHAMQMTGPPLGGSTWTAACTLGGILCRYYANLLAPLRLSVVYDASPIIGSVLPGLVGYLALGIWAIGALHLRLRLPTLFASWIWFLAPLIPVSQIAYSLQNTIADRYLLFPALAPALLIASAVTVNHPKVRICNRGALAVVVATLAVLSWTRASCFSSSSRLFADATNKTSLSGIAPYQLGRALESEGDLDAAERALLETISRSASDQRSAELASLALARLKQQMGDLQEASAILTAAQHRAPKSAAVVKALAIVRAEQGLYHDAADLRERWRSLQYTKGSSADPKR